MRRGERESLDTHHEPVSGCPGGLEVMLSRASLSKQGLGSLDKPHERRPTGWGRTKQMGRFVRCKLCVGVLKLREPSFVQAESSLFGSYFGAIIRGPVDPKMSHSED